MQNIVASVLQKESLKSANTFSNKRRKTIYKKCQVVLNILLKCVMCLLQTVTVVKDDAIYC